MLTCRRLLRGLAFGAGIGAVAGLVIGAACGLPALFGPGVMDSLRIFGTVILLSSIVGVVVGAIAGVACHVATDGLSFVWSIGIVVASSTTSLFIVRPQLHDSGFMYVPAVGAVLGGVIVALGGLIRQKRDGSLDS